MARIVGWRSGGGSPGPRYSDDGGATWLAGTVDSAPSGDPRFAFGGGTYVCFFAGAGSSQIISSTDGIAWTRRTHPPISTGRGLWFLGGQFCALADSLSVVLRSADGITWTSAATGSSIEAGFTRIISRASNTKFSGRVVCLETEYQLTSGSLATINQYVMVTTDGITWSRGRIDAVSVVDTDINAYSKSYAPAFSNATDIIFVEVDGVTKTSYSASLTAPNVWTVGAASSESGLLFEFSGSNVIMSPEDGSLLAIDGIKSTADGLSYTVRLNSPGVQTIIGGAGERFAFNIFTSRAFSSTDDISWPDVTMTGLIPNNSNMAVNPAEGALPPSGGDGILPSPFLTMGASGATGRGGAGPGGFWTAFQRSRELP